MHAARLVHKSVLVALVLVAAVSLRAQTVAPVSPGPPMWKVTSGEHALWIFPMLTPLEAGVNWHSDEVESIIRHAQEYIYFKNPEPRIPINPFKLVNGLRLVLKIRKNPDGKRLEEVVPAALYSRFALLVDLYQIPDMEETRPYYAADSLRGYAITANGLTEDHGVDIRIESLVSENLSMASTPIYVGPERLDYDFLIDSAQRMSQAASIEDEIRCLELSVDSVEADIESMRHRARAWASGDVDALRQNRDVIDARGICAEVLLTSELLDAARARWLSAVEQALDNNSISFAVVELGELLEADGLLEKLKSRGYTIDAP